MFKSTPRTTPALRSPVSRIAAPVSPIGLISLIALIALVALPARPALAGPIKTRPADPDWRTLVVGDGAFRVHYPAASEAWARRAAARLVDLRTLLATEIGFQPEQAIDVVVTDPQARPNGSAWALLGAPRMVLWTSPPEPTSILGTYRDWGELVATHEAAHLVHMLRPSRQPWRRMVFGLLPLGGPGPISLRAPRWVTEGYATLLEGQLTGAGRPHSDLVAAVLRERALAGRLPSYGALGGDDHSWLGRSMAYLGGSAYLAWLERRTGPQGLRDLWARMTARRNRSFDAAFTGVFGDDPATLYGRFTAEMTWRAVEVEHAVEGLDAAPGPASAQAGAGDARPDGRPSETSARGGDTLWLARGWRTGAPAVSPDGSRLAVVLRARNTPPRLAVYTTADDPDAAKQRAEAVEQLLARDPEDVPGVEPEAPPRTPQAVLATVDGHAPAEPRWLADGRTLLFSAPGVDDAGFVHYDLYRWVPGEGRSARPERITHLADLRSADPAPGRGDAWAVAVRNRHGQSQLVRVDLFAGEVAALTEPSVETVWATPRFAPDGRRLVAVRNRGGRWELVLFAVDGPDGSPTAPALRELAVLPTPGELVADPAWSPDGRTLYAAASVPARSAFGVPLGSRPGHPLGHPLDSGAGDPGEARDSVGSPAGPRAGTGTGSFVELVAFDGAIDGADGDGEHSRDGDLAKAATGSLAWKAPPRTLTRSVGAALAPAPTPDGRALFYLGLTDHGLDVRRLALNERPAESSPSGSVRAGSPPLGSTAAVDVDALPSAGPYRFGPREHAPLVGIALSPAGESLEAGVAGSDPVGRLDWIALGAVATDGAPSGAVVSATVRRPATETSFHLFTVDLAPSEQRDPEGRAPVAAAGGLDVTRRGVAAERRWQRRRAPFTVRLGLGLVAGQVAGQTAGRVETRGAAGHDTVGTGWARLDGGLFYTPSRGLWQGLLGLGARLERGETDGDAWSRSRGAFTAGLFHDGQGLRLTWLRYGSDDLRFAFDRFQVGGVGRSVLPALADDGRIEVPALAAGTLVGDAAESQRIDLTASLLPGPFPSGTRLFWERHRAWDEGRPRSDWLTLAGLELSRSIDPLPLLGLPGSEITAGAAYLLDTPDEHDRGDVRLWAAIRWRP